MIRLDLGLRLITKIVLDNNTPPLHPPITNFQSTSRHGRMLGFSMLTILTNKKAGLEVPHSRFKIGLSAKKWWMGMGTD